MKKSSFLLALLAVFNLTAQEKNSASRNGNSYDYKNFDKINFIGFNDDIQVSAGKNFKVEIETKEENRKYLVLNLNEKEHELTIKLDNFSNKQHYKDRETYKVKISMPELSVLSNLGNGDVNIDGVLGRYFRAKTTGNGDINCNGKIDELDIEKTGNGEVNAKNLLSKKAKIQSTGNGNVDVNVSEKLTAKNTGNGDVTNYGKAQFDSNSKNIGNGELLNK